MRGQGFGFIAPLLVLMVVAFNAPIVYMLGLAFWEKGRGFTLEHYEGLVETPVYLRVLGNTMRISLIATLANVAIGYPLAHWMRGLGGRARMIAIALVVLPFWVSILVRTYAWIVVLGNGGLVNRALQWTRPDRRAGVVPLQRARRHHRHGQRPAAVPRAAAVRRHDPHRRPAAAGGGLARRAAAHDLLEGLLSRSPCRRWRRERCWSSSSASASTSRRPSWAAAACR